MVLWLLSLFYTSQELSSFQSTLDASSEAPLLQGILYHSPTHWRLWVNGRSIDETEAQYYGISHVSQQQVCFKKERGPVCIQVGDPFIG